MHSITRWFIDNPIAAKIIMVVILVSGTFSFPIISKQFFPDGEIDLIKISMVYPGAGPEEVESQVIRRIEESVENLSGIEEIRSVAREGSAQVTIEVESGEDTTRLLNDVKANVESITTFPAGAELPQIVEQRYQNTIMWLLLSGDLEERELKELGETIREEIADIPSVMITELRGVRDYEVSIEISESRLAQYELTFSDVARAIRGYSFTLPTGKINHAGGDIQLQARLQAEDAADFYSIPLIRSPNGAVVRVSDVATVKDSFADTDFETRFEGHNALQIEVINRERPQILRTAEDVRAYVKDKQLSLPDSVSLDVWADMSIAYQGRLDTLIKNGLGGLSLVFIILLIFLRPMLAFWVCLGIIVAFSGALWLLSFTSVSLNVLSIFAFIMILGIIVDDAIIVGEAVYSQQSKLGDLTKGAIAGVQSIMMPVCFAVVSTIVFFVPFFFLSDSPNTAHLGMPVILALIFSLIESLLLLPSHLAHGGLLQTLFGFIRALFRPLDPLFAWLEKYRLKAADFLPWVASTIYRRILLRAIVAPSYVLMVFGFLFVSAITLVGTGWIKTSFQPIVTSDYVVASATLPESASYNQVYTMMERLERDAEEVRERINHDHGQEIIEGVFAYAFESNASVNMRITTSMDRPLSAVEVADEFRRQIGQVSGVKDLNVRYTIFDLPKPVSFNVLAADNQNLQAYSKELANYIASIEGTYDIQSSLEHPVKELNFRLNTNAESLSVSMLDIATQIRQAFYGEEVQRIPREREDVKVFVRYPENDRGYEEELQDMLIQVPNGTPVPLNALVDFEYRDSLKTIDRIDGERVAVISSELEPGFSGDAIVNQVMTFAETQLAARFPDVDIQLKGEQEESREFREKLQFYFIMSMLVIYGLMAVMFKSYTEPVLVLSAVPFGYVGGLLGHFMLDVTFSMLSMLGALACAGVVVNDNVVLIDRINKLRRLGFSVRRAAVNGAIERFRPIVLTSVTTFLGLTPILLEQSVQAQFLIPMVVSLAFGVLFATSVTLLFVPSLYILGDNLGRRIGISHRTKSEPELAALSQGL